VELETQEGSGESAGPVHRRVVSPESRLRAADLAGLADRAGLTDGRTRGEGFGQQLRAAESAGVTDVIVNAMESEPMLTADRQVLDEQAETVITGAVWLHRALGARHVWLAVDDASPDRVDQLRVATHRSPVRVAVLPARYPQGKPPLLTRSVVGREVPCGQPALLVGVFVVELSVLAALVPAVLEETPQTSRVITVTGSAVKRPGHYRVPFGVSVREVIEQVGMQGRLRQVIDGGPMTGRAVRSTDAVITRQTSALVLLDDRAVRTPRPRACVRCGWCQEDCPVGLDPRALLGAFERGRERTAWLHPEACVECGLCSYVCPVELPLAEAAISLRRRTIGPERPAPA
jgi:electron transport complex protein RnfC